MKLTSLLIAILLFGCAGSKRSLSDASTSRWFKGNLHTHSLWSGGDGYPEMIVDWYKKNGYHFIALSDHNVLAEGEKWVLVPRSKMHEDAFQRYLARFGDNWVEQRLDTGRIHVRLKTFEEYQKLFREPSFLMIRSEEITDRFEGKPIHLNATNIKELVQPQHGSSVSDVMQRNIDAVLSQREKTGVAMFPHVNHPNFYFAISTEDMIALRGERFFEVYNGHPLVHNDGDSLRPGTEVMWDRINMAYFDRRQPLLFGLATDDSHNYHQFGKAYSNAGRGWVVVRADSLDPTALITAMEAGDFYSSTGVILDEYTIKDNTISIKIKTETGVSYKIEVIQSIKGSNSVAKNTITATSARIVVNSHHRYIRLKIISTKLKENPFRDNEVEVAWTQPVAYQ